MLTCTVCHVNLPSLKAYVGHYRLHANVCNVRFPCGVRNCTQFFKTYSAFQTHVSRDHRRLRQTTGRGLMYGQRHQENVDLQCSLTSCQQECSDFQEILGHYKLHIKQGHQMTCFFHNCSNSYTVVSSFTSHISRVHPQEILTPSSATEDAVLRNENDADCCSVGGTCADEFNISNEDTLEETFEEDEIENNNLDDAYLQHMTLFYLRLQTKHHIPKSTIQVIVEELNGIHDIQSQHDTQMLKRKLTAEGIPSETVNKVLIEIEQNDLFLKVHNTSDGKLRSTHTRKQHYTSELGYVKPVALKIGKDDDGKDQYCHYVPIKETLKALLKNPSVLHQYQNPKQHTDTLDIYTDFQDGSIYKDIELFKRLQNSLKIILYQDTFEIVNPLGAAKKKHKIVGVYYSLGNLYPHHRSKIDPIQLVCLCTEKNFQKFGQAKVFARLITDLKSIEDDGVDIGEQEKVLGTVVAILGDNLGSHEIGGYTMNFSTTEFMCRFCLIHREDLWERGLADNVELRTEDDYNRALQQLAHDPHLSHCEGVKCDSVFNALKYFHVCRGLPPCLGHDLFEGIVKYDLAAALEYFVEQAWFTYKELNSLMRNFTLMGNDALDKHNDISHGASIGGNAVQNWCFLRILPFLIAHRIEDLQDPVWELVLTLREIVELVCAPSITLAQIAYLDDLVTSYVTLFKKCFEDVRFRPKCHYLTHYAKLIMMFGPLIRLWTMRMEAKHSYFKQCARSAQNFKNITFTLSEKHQLLQAYLGAGSVFGVEVECPQHAIQFCKETYNAAIQDAVTSYPEIDHNSLVCHAIIVRGTEYKEGQFVAIKRVDGYLKFGKIVLIIVSTSVADESLCPFVVTQLYSSVYVKNLGLHKLEDEKSICCMKVSKLLDHQPLYCYKMCGVSDTTQYLALKHAIIDNFQC